MNYISSYVSALSDVFQKDEELAFVSFLQELYNFIKSDFSKVFFSFLGNPLVKNDEKHKVLSDASGLLDERLLNFMKVAISSNRGDVLFLILEKFIMFSRSKMEIVDVVVFSSVDWSENDIKDLSDVLLLEYAAIDSIKVTLDKSIIGGCVVKIDNRVFDFSLKNQLNAFSAIAFEVCEKFLKNL